MGSKDGIGADARFYRPSGIEVDGSGNVIVVDAENHKIRKITSGGIVSTLAGSIQSFADGTGATAKFNTPSNVALDISGNYLVTDYWNNRVRKVTPDGVVTTFAGSGEHGSYDGTVTTATIYHPRDIATDAFGNVFLCNDDSKIRWITPAGEVRTVNTENLFTALAGIAVDADGMLYVSDQAKDKVYKVTIQ